MLLWMADEVEQVADSLIDLEVEPPSAVDPSLPNTAFRVNDLRP